MSKVTIKLEDETELIIETDFGTIKLHQHMVEVENNNFRTVLDITHSKAVECLPAQYPITRFSKKLNK